MTAFTFEKDFSHHPLHYFTLLCVQLVGLWGLFWFNYQPNMQLSILLSMAVSYVVWGIVHHQDHHDLHIKIVIEYILVATLAVLMFGSLLLRT
jgi:hypothetical protein